MDPVKETKAQRAERLKLEQNPWEGLQQIREYCSQGFDNIPPVWKNMYFRWWGVYTQGDGLGVTGGKGGEGNAAPYFMVRIRLPNGQLYSHQIRTIADLTERYARNTADITVRQNFQLHWVPAEALPDIFEALWQCGLTTLGACGDVTRNVTGCPLAGLDANEVFDASPHAHAIAKMMVGNDEFYNFPRKYKICITGCKDWCAYPEINDIGMTAVTRKRLLGPEERGFHVRVGGGLSTEPFLAAKLNCFVPEHQVNAVVLGISRIFRDANELRENRERARLKYLFLRHGWTAESFLDELHNRLGFKLDESVEEHAPDDVHRDHVGIHAQKQKGYSYVGASVLSGRITPEQMRATADLADKYAAGEIRTTIMQNIAIVNVPTERAAALAAEMTAAGLPVQGSHFHRGVIACTGTEFCKLAITETKGFARWLAVEMDERLPQFDEDLKIHVTGCPNGCGQHRIADIGLEGKKIKVDGKLTDAYYFYVGGALGERSTITRGTGYRCAVEEVPDAMARLLSGYMQVRRKGERLASYFSRTDDEHLKTLLAGEAP